MSSDDDPDAGSRQHRRSEPQPTAPTASTWPAPRPRRRPARSRRSAYARPARGRADRRTGPARPPAPTPTSATPSCSTPRVGRLVADHGWERRPAGARRLRPLGRAGRGRGRRARHAGVLRRRPAGGAHRLHRLGHPAASCSPRPSSAASTRSSGTAPSTLIEVLGPHLPSWKKGLAVGPRRSRAARHLRLSPARPACRRADLRASRTYGDSIAPPVRPRERPSRAAQGEISRHITPPGTACVDSGPLTGYHGRRVAGSPSSGPPCVMGPILKRCA